ncbi:hypothetical protein [Vibrio alginolyticus]|uniref:hypothetical protein n=1 Tax=Vibrio alginolyticus TaxID=663 RepID=UPI00211A92C7|nr:hypothetical protein [Vibrio alginolyticus]MCQ9070504.1 hypothetical protein [Vibrio alginolyticus]
MAKNIALRTFEAGQLKGNEWLSPNYYIVLAESESDFVEADSRYESLRESRVGEGYYRDYLDNVEAISKDTYCDVKYFIKDVEGRVVGYLGLWTKPKVVRGFVQIPLVPDYDPLTTLLLKLWMFHHLEYEKVYYTMRYGFYKVSPIDKYMGVVCLGRVNPQADEFNAAHTFYFKTIKGGADVIMA